MKMWNENEICKLQNTVLVKGGDENDWGDENEILCKLQKTVLVKITHR